MHSVSVFNQQQRCGVKEQGKKRMFCLRKGNYIMISHSINKILCIYYLFFQSATWKQSIWWSVWTFKMINVVWLQSNVIKVMIFFNYLKLWASAALDGLQVLSVNIIRASFNRWKQWNELKSCCKRRLIILHFSHSIKKRNVPSGVQMKDILITSRPVFLMFIYTALFNGAI